MPRLLPLLAAFALLSLGACSFGGVTPGLLEGGLPVNDAADASNVGTPCQGGGLACGADLLCISGACRKACGTADECPPDSRCLFVTPDGGAKLAFCVDALSLECVPECTGQCQTCAGPGCGFCPTPSLCAPGGSCRNSCPKGEASECPKGDLCTGGICTGTGNHSSAAAP